MNGHRHTVVHVGNGEHECRPFPAVDSLPVYTVIECNVCGRYHQLNYASSLVDTGIAWRQIFPTKRQIRKWRREGDR